ncbi:MAG TPA: dienelactone hydrolase family protein [Xanthobacteraceae bacterium]|jgi:carboxymethylenebutenolidase
MDQRIINLYDCFTHGGFSRREFLDRLAELAGSAAAAAVLLPMLHNNYAQAAVVAPDDQKLASETATYDAGGASISGYLTRFKDKSKRPAVIVIHENRGLNPHIEDVARRLALEGFLALAVDMLSPLGGTPTDEDKAREMIGSLKLDETERQAAAAVQFLQSHGESNGRVGAIGFCWGGTMVNRLAAASPSLKAGVAYYGRQIPAERVPSIEAALLLQYAGNDEPVNAGIPAYEAALQANGKKYLIHRYEGAQHAFNNDTNAARYNKPAADLAWERTVAFLKEQLGTPGRA